MKDFNVKDFERYSKEYGVYDWKGVELALIQEPFLGEDVFGDACYYAAAIDSQGNEWGVKWEVLPEIDINDTDAGDHCDWENPTHAKMIQCKVETPVCRRLPCGKRY